MRLSATELDGITNAAKDFLGSRHGELYLYGSRVNEKLKGGDIDLLLLVCEEDANALAPRKHVFIKLLQDRLGERRFDVAIFSREQAERDSFYGPIVSNKIATVLLFKV